MTCRKMSIKQKEKFAFNLIRGFCARGGHAHCRLQANVCIARGGRAEGRGEAEVKEEAVDEAEAVAKAKATTAKQQ